MLRGLRSPLPPSALPKSLGFKTEVLDSSLDSDIACYRPSSRVPGTTRNLSPRSGSCPALQPPCLVLRLPLLSPPVGHRREQAA